jgi:hypothetical protein
VQLVASCQAAYAQKHNNERCILPIHDSPRGGGIESGMPES